MKWKWPGIIAGVCLGLAIGYFVLSNQEETGRVASEPVVVSQAGRRERDSRAKMGTPSHARL